LAASNALDEWRAFAMRSDFFTFEVEVRFGTLARLGGANDRARLNTYLHDLFLCKDVL